MTREEDSRNDNSDESMILSPLYSVILSEAKNLTPYNLRKGASVRHQPCRAKDRRWITSGNHLLYASPLGDTLNTSMVLLNFTNSTLYLPILIL